MISIVICYRDREEHLKILVPRLREYAKQKQLDIEIIVSEQADSNPLRRGALRNEGVRIAKGDIIALHDVDYIPTDDVIYWPEQRTDVFRPVKRVNFVNMDGSPRNISDVPSGYQTFKDGIDDNFFGGVLCITKNTFFSVNGYNPLYEGWGIEDDDFRERLRNNKFVITDGSGTFEALPHPDSFKNDDLFRRNQQIFANQIQFGGNGIRNTNTTKILSHDKARRFGVDKWLEVTDWNIINPPVEPQISSLDYGYFAIFPNSHQDHVQKCVAEGKRWEPKVMALCEKYVQPNTTVIDVGANMGTFTVRLAQLVGSKGRVIAFEPQRLVYQQLCCNIFLNGLTNVDAYQRAVGNGKEDDGIVTLTPINYKNGAPGEVRVSGNNGELVECWGLDNVIFEQDISLIKIDVERYEPFVFDGAQKIIRGHRPVILFELTTLPLPDYPKDYIVKMLAELNYNVYEISEWGDYLAIPQEKDDNV